MNLETERLVLRPVAPDDHDTLHALFTEPGVRRVIFDDVIIPPQQTAEIIEKSGRLFETERFGLWNAVLPPPSGAALIGFGGFWYFRDPPELELLYGVGDAHVKRGFGREIATAVVRYGFDVLAMSEIRASTHPSHLDSRRVLEHLGFSLERQALIAGLETVFYRKCALR
jgi:[ribosomal protein S5]-alanine N-acetyltransferase